MVRNGLSALSFLILLMISGPAWGFALGDHARITVTAFREARNCLPELSQVLSATDEAIVIHGVLQEDLNLIRKWYRYSHYYNPYKKLDMRREDSSVSVRETEAELMKSAQDPSISIKEDWLLGRAIHYLQDAASPPHVVPVQHGLTDGFEDYSGPELKTVSDCDWVASAQLHAAEGLFTVLKATAMETYDGLSRSVPYQRDGKPEEKSWLALFWKPGPGAEFGTYGTFGNRFGETEFKVKGDEIRVDRLVYEDFREERLRSAVMATREALLWFRLNFLHSREATRRLVSSRSAKQ